MLASLRLSDIPVGYQPARGPSAEFRLTYNQREGFTPQIPTFSHVGPRWTFNWLSYVKEQPPGDGTVPAAPVEGVTRHPGSAHAPEEAFRPR